MEHKHTIAFGYYVSYAKIVFKVDQWEVSE